MISPSKKLVLPYVTLGISGSRPLPLLVHRAATLNTGFRSHHAASSAFQSQGVLLSIFSNNLLSPVATLELDFFRAHDFLPVRSKVGEA